MKPENLAKAIALRHELHAHPELSMEEVWTRSHLMEFLRENTKNLEIVDCGRWFYAMYRAENPKGTIGFRADFDALPIEESLPDLPYASTNPGVSHKCGHDGHAASLAGLALEIDQEGCDKNVVFLFQHAEETGAGAKETVETLSKLGIDEFYAYHNHTGPQPKHSILFRKGIAQCASTGMTIAMTGTVAHASMPENGVSPAIPLAKLACALPELAAPELYKSMVLCTIVQIAVGEKAFGVAPGYGELSITVRAEYEDELQDLLKKITDLAHQLAEEQGLGVEITYDDYFPETRNADWCVDKVRKAAEELGLTICELEEPRRGSVDFGHIIKAIPGCIFRVGDGPELPPTHTYLFDFPDEIIETAVEMFKKLTTL